MLCTSGNKSDKTDSTDYDCKIVLVGDGKCGKTSLIHRFLNDRFIDIYTPTGFDRYSAMCEIGDKRIPFTIWDTSGSPAYDTVRHLAYSEARVFLISFQIGQPESLENAVHKWYPEIKKYCPSVPVILCGCQSDMRNDIETISNLAKVRRIPVTSEQALSASRQIGAVTYVETSAKTIGKSAKESFEVAALAALGKLNKNHAVLQRQRSYTKAKSKPSKKVNIKTELKDKARGCVLM